MKCIPAKKGDSLNGMGAEYFLLLIPDISTVPQVTHILGSTSQLSNVAARPYLRLSLHRARHSGSISFLLSFQHTGFPQERNADW